MLSKYARFLKVVREEGLPRALRLARHRAASARWERSLGVDTGGDHLLVQEGLDRPGHHAHSPSSVVDLRRAFRIACPSPEAHTLIDFGSGKGRVVLMAAMQPFRRVIGVEVSPMLSAAAHRNLEIARPRLRCQDVTFVTARAEEFAIPGDVTVAYFYNPFSGEAMERVVENLRLSLAATPRTLRIVFATPPHFERAVAGREWVKPIAEFSGLRRHVIYEWLPHR